MGLIASKLTYEHLRQLPDDGRRYELIEGDLVVTPAPKRRHQRQDRLGCPLFPGITTAVADLFAD